MEEQRRGDRRDPEAVEEPHGEDYETPTIKDLGSFGDLTRGGGAGGDDPSGASQIG